MWTLYGDNVANSKCHVKRQTIQMGNKTDSIVLNTTGICQKHTDTVSPMHWSITKPSLLVIMLLKWPNHHYYAHNIEKCVMAKRQENTKKNLIECTLHLTNGLRSATQNKSKNIGNKTDNTIALQTIIKCYIFSYFVVQCDLAFLWMQACNWCLADSVFVVKQTDTSNIDYVLYFEFSSFFLFK